MLFHFGTPEELFAFEGAEVEYELHFYKRRDSNSLFRLHVEMLQDKLPVDAGTFAISNEYNLHESKAKTYKTTSPHPLRSRPCGLNLLALVPTSLSSCSSNLTTPRTPFPHLLPHLLFLHCSVFRFVRPSHEPGRPNEDVNTHREEEGQ